MALLESLPSVIGQRQASPWTIRDFIETGQHYNFWGKAEPGVGHISGTHLCQCDPEIK